ncbi:succinate dehydrogenase/fumarate reductase flavoprotein subunit, partial [Salmonella enterica]
ISRVITLAALERKDSRGAHFREDFPKPDALETSTYTLSRLVDGKLRIESAPVAFTRVKPGETLLKETPAAAE